MVDIEVDKLFNRLEDKAISIDLDKSAKLFIADKGYQPEMGARPIRRAIQTYLEDPLSEKLLLDPDSEREYEITHEEGAESLTFKEKKKKKERSPKKLATAAASEEENN